MPHPNAELIRGGDEAFADSDAEQFRAVPIDAYATTSSGPRVD